MKRRKDAPQNQEAPIPSDRVNEQDRNEVACLEQLRDELEHPTRSRREGARAAVRCLSRLVHLRATAERIPRHNAWTRVFDTNQLIGSTTEDPGDWDAVEPVLSATAAEAARDLFESTASLSVEHVVSSLERSIVEREQLRDRARQAGVSVTVEPLN